MSVVILGKVFPREFALVSIPPLWECLLISKIFPLKLIIPYAKHGARVTYCFAVKNYFTDCNGFTEVHHSGSVFFFSKHRGFDINIILACWYCIVKAGVCRCRFHSGLNWTRRYNSLDIRFVK